MTRIFPALALLLIAGCARSEDANLVPPDSNQGYNQVGKVGTPEQDDREPAIGQWRASLQENVQALEFGPMGTGPLFSLLCTGNQSVLLQRHGGAPAGPLPAMQVTIGELNERLAVTAGGGTIPMLRAEVPLNSRIAAALGSAAQPFSIRSEDGAPLIIPASPLIADYLRHCTTVRPGQAGPAAPGQQPGNAAGAAPPATNNAASAAPANAAQPKQ
jgi:hypothetical protein